MAKGKVIINQNICKGCGLCISVCPVKILEMEKAVINNKGYLPAYVREIEKCTGCSNCAIICPDSAISVYRSED